MAGPLGLLARAMLGSEVLRPAYKAASEALPHPMNRVLPSNQPTFYELLKASVEPAGRLLGILPEEQPQTNLPMDYYASPTGVMSSAGEPMITGQGISGFQPASEYETTRNFVEPAYTPPLVPEQGSWTMQGGTNIPSQIALGSPQQEFPPQRTYSFERDLAGLDTGSGSVPLPQQGADYTVAPPSFASFGGSSFGGSYQPESSYWNPIQTPQQELGQVMLPEPDLARNLPSAYAPPAPSSEEDEERERFFMSAAPTMPVILRQRDFAEERARGGLIRRGGLSMLAARYA